MAEPTALEQAWEVQRAASDVGFDWDDIAGPLEKVNEEIREVVEALASKNTEHLQEELGDLLFAVVNLSRFIEFHPETALRQATKKFECRFEEVKKIISSENKTLEECSLGELNEVWDRVKGVE